MGDVRTLPLPWSQLTELNLGCIAPWQADESGNLNLRNGLELLRRCPNLVQCYLNIVTSDLPFVAGPTVTLVHLQTLIVRTVDTTIEFLKCLFLPNIRYLHIWDGDVYIGPTPALQPLERRPRSFTVKLSPELFSRLALVELLQRYPEVSQFILHPEKHRHDSIFDDAFLSILTPNPEAPTSLLCPYLKRLQFANGNAQCSDAAVVQFIRARMETGNPVEEIDIGFGRQIETDILPDLQPFISEGLRVNLRYYTTFKWEYNAREGLSLDEV
ncbi:hypothetical protein B0H10DRAFT_890489 [Mycena sp. CBHHK59/15]|nr:hypothetical protein B0H10DRAFT_890489 [Mycena sp. CBHHK59/15]